MELLADAQADVCTTDKPNKVKDLEGILSRALIGASSLGDTSSSGLQGGQRAGSGGPYAEWSKCGHTGPGWSELSGSGHREWTDVCFGGLVLGIICCLMR